MREYCLIFRAARKFQFHNDFLLKIVVCVVLLTAALPLWAQTGQPALDRSEEPFSFVGMKVDELYRRLGPPQSVYAARGEETWQDDVVFVYNEGDFYIFQDRVWQMGVKSVRGLKLGDVQGVALLILGNEAQHGSDYSVYAFPGSAWPLSIRVNYEAGKITSIFIYRPDF